MKRVGLFLCALCVRLVTGCMSIYAAEQQSGQNDNRTVVDDEGTEYVLYDYNEYKDHPYYIMQRRGITSERWVDTIYVKPEINGIPVTVIRNGGGVRKLILSNNITQIEGRAFAEEGIEEIVITDSVTYIGEYPFSLSNLKKVTIGNGIKKLNAGFFSECRQLEEVIISEGVVEIADGTFGGDGRIRSLTIPASVKNIGTHAFNLNLKNVTVYGYCNSYAEKWAKSMGYRFESIGSVSESIDDHTPLAKILSVTGNTMTVSASTTSSENGWDGYLYDVCKIFNNYDEDYDVEYTSSERWYHKYCINGEKVVFPYLPKGNYYLRCKGYKETQNGKEYSNWSLPVFTRINPKYPEPPRYQKSRVTRNKNGTYNVTITLKTIKNQRYDCVLGKTVDTRELYQMCKYRESKWTDVKEVKPSTYAYVIKNRNTQTVTFKNVKKGIYYFGAHSFNLNGKKIFGMWSGAEKIEVR